MVVKQSLQIPLGYDLPVNAQIRIELRNEGYRFCIKSDWEDWSDFFVYHLKPHDVKDLNTRLQLAIQEASASFEEHDADRTTQQEALLKLAMKGAAAFNRIFKDTLGDTIREILAACKTLQISSNDFFIPWELLYDGPLEDQTDISHFWGMKYIISRNMIRVGTSDGFVSPILDACPQVGLIVNNELPYVIEHEIATLQELHQQNQIQLSSLRPLNPTQRQAELTELGKFLNQEIHILHIACHAEEEEIRQEPYRLLSEVVLKEPHLIVSDNFHINMEDFDAQGFKVGHHPLVILNACTTGTLTPLRTSNWAVLFWERGARCVVATEFRVPDWFAARFIEELYVSFLSGRTIGEALLSTRRYFALNRKYPNPLGLAYTLYSRLSIRINKQALTKQKLMRRKHG